jgi:hypothetical protein
MGDAEPAGGLDTLSLLSDPIGAAAAATVNTATGSGNSSSTSLNPLTNVVNAISSNAANYALIGVGIVLALGALLISQKQPMQNIVGAASSAARSAAGSIT